MNSMRNRTLAVSAVSIPYYPSLREYAGSIGSSILMVQLDFYFGLQNKNGVCEFEGGFYKFLEPNSHHNYREGDSWAEVMHLTVDEFRTLFDKLGVRYPSLSAYRSACSAGDPFKGKYYLSYCDKKTNLTWYLRNHVQVDSLLDKVFSGSDRENRSKQDKPQAAHSTCKNPSPGDGKIHPLSCESPSPELAKTYLHNTKITPKTTPTTTTKAGVVVVDIDELVESAVWEQKPHGFKTTENRFRRWLKKKFENEEPSQADLHTLQAWRKVMSPKPQAQPTPPAPLEIDREAQNSWFDANPKRRKFIEAHGVKL